MGRVLAAALVVAASCTLGESVTEPRLSKRVQRDLFVMFSAVATRVAPRSVARYVEPRDYLRREFAGRVPGRDADDAARYVLPATVRERWADEPGVTHWVRSGCSGDGRETIVYDPEHWELTPRREQRRFVHSIGVAGRIAGRKECFSFGIAPDGVFLFGLHPERCSLELARGAYRRIPWNAVDLVDIQAQLLIGDDCVQDMGVDDYVEVIREVATTARRANPHIAVVAQVSFRHTPPSRMKTAIAAVAGDIDGVFFSYPSRGFRARCEYCSVRNLHELLRFLRR